MERAKILIVTNGQTLPLSASRPEPTFADNRPAYDDGQEELDQPAPDPQPTQ